MRTAEAWEAFLVVQDARIAGRKKICGGKREMCRFRFLRFQAHVAFEYLVRGSSIKRLLQAGAVGRPGETKIRWAHV